MEASLDLYLWWQMLALTSGRSSYPAKTMLEYPTFQEWVERAFGQPLSLISLGRK